MRITIPKTLLSEKLHLVAKAIPVRSTIPSAEGVLMEYDGERVTLTANNLEMAIRVTFPLTGIDKGSVILPSKMVDISKHLPGETVDIEIDTQTMETTVVSSKTEFQLHGLEGEDFPVFPSPENDNAVFAFSVYAADIKRVLRQTLFAASQDESRPAFTGVLFSLQNGTLSVSASDTFRLATTSCPAQAGEGEKGEILVPAKVLQEVIRIFPSGEETVSVFVIGNQLLLKCGEIQFSSRLLDESFPDVNKVIPREFSIAATIETASLRSAIERSLLLSEGVNHVARFKVDDKKIMISSASKFGRVQEEVPLDLEGEEIEIVLNARFVLDMLKSNEGKHTLLQLTGKNKPCVFKDSLYDEYLYLVLPVKS